MNFILIVLLIFLVLLAALAATWRAFYHLVVQPRYLFRLASAVHRFPARLQLEKLEPFAWSKGERGAQRVAEFEAAGFTGAGGCRAAELAGAKVFFLRHPLTGFIGVVNEMDALGTWSDVALFTEGGPAPIFASGILNRSHLHFLPGDPKIHKPDATVRELVEAVRAAAPRGTASRHLEPAEVAPLYEQAFADAADARLLTALVDYELRRLTLERGPVCCGELSDEEFTGIKSLLPLAVDNELRLACGAQFVRETRISGQEWRRAFARLLVHDRTPLRRLAGKFIGGAFLTQELRRALRKVRVAGAPRAEFAAFNEKQPAWLRYRKMGEVTRPVPADIYCAPMTRGTGG